MTSKTNRRIATAACLAWLLSTAAPGIAVAAEARAVGAGLLEMDGRMVVLAGLHAPPPGAVCRADGRDWPCGRAARLALDARVAGRELHCEPAGVSASRCAIGNADLSRWLVAEGWAKAGRDAPAELRDVEAEAQASGLGIWRGGEAGADWRVAGDAAADLPCEACPAPPARATGADTDL